ARRHDGQAWADDGPGPRHPDAVAGTDRGAAEADGRRRSAAWFALRAARNSGGPAARRVQPAAAIPRPRRRQAAGPRRRLQSVRGEEEVTAQECPLSLAGEGLGVRVWRASALGSLRAL